MDLDFARRVFRGDERLCSLVGRVGWGLLVCMLYGVMGLPGWYCFSVGCMIRAVKVPRYIQRMYECMDAFLQRLEIAMI